MKSSFFLKMQDSFRNNLTDLTIKKKQNSIDAINTNNERDCQVICTKIFTKSNKRINGLTLNIYDSVKWVNHPTQVPEFQSFDVRLHKYSKTLLRMCILSLRDCLCAYKSWSYTSILIVYFKTNSFNFILSEELCASEGYKLTSKH